MRPNALHSVNLLPLTAALLTSHLYHGNSRFRILAATTYLKARILNLPGTERLADLWPSLPDDLKTDYAELILKTPLAFRWGLLGGVAPDPRINPFLEEYGEYLKIRRATSKEAIGENLGEIFAALLEKYPDLAETVVPPQNERSKKKMQEEAFAAAKKHGFRAFAANKDAFPLARFVQAAMSTAEEAFPKVDWKKHAYHFHNMRNAWLFCEVAVEAELLRELLQSYRTSFKDYVAFQVLYNLPYQTVYSPDLSLNMTKWGWMLGFLGCKNHAYRYPIRYLKHTKSEGRNAISQKYKLSLVRLASVQKTKYKNTSDFSTKSTRPFHRPVADIRSILVDENKTIRFAPKDPKALDIYFGCPLAEPGKSTGRCFSLPLRDIQNKIVEVKGDRFVKNREVGFHTGYYVVQNKTKKIKDRNDGLCYDFPYEVLFLEKRSLFTSSLKSSVFTQTKWACRALDKLVAKNVVTKPDNPQPKEDRRWRPEFDQYLAVLGDIPKLLDTMKKDEDLFAKVKDEILRSRDERHPYFWSSGSAVKPKSLPAWKPVQAVDFDSDEILSSDIRKVDFSSIKRSAPAVNLLSAAPVVKKAVPVVVDRFLDSQARIVFEQAVDHLFVFLENPPPQKLEVHEEGKRIVVQGESVHKVMDKILNHIVQVVVQKINKDHLSYALSNYLPGCSPMLYSGERIRDAIKGKEIDLLNLDVKSCFDSINLLHPNFEKILDEGIACLDVVSSEAKDLVRKIFSYQLKMVKEDKLRFVSAKDGTAYKTVPGVLPTGFVLAPLLWTVLALPPCLKTKAQVESRKLVTFDLCGDDFFAVAEAGKLTEADRLAITKPWFDLAAALDLRFHYFKNYKEGYAKPSQTFRNYFNYKDCWARNFPARSIPIYHAGVVIARRSLVETCTNVVLHDDDYDPVLRVKSKLHSDLAKKGKRGSAMFASNEFKIVLSRSDLVSAVRPSNDGGLQNVGESQPGKDQALSSKGRADCRERAQRLQSILYGAQTCYLRFKSKKKPTSPVYEHQIRDSDREVLETMGEQATVRLFARSKEVGIVVSQKLTLLSETTAAFNFREFEDLKARGYRFGIERDERQRAEKKWAEMPARWDGGFRTY